MGFSIGHMGGGGSSAPSCRTPPPPSRYPAAHADARLPDWNLASPGYFKTMQQINSPWPHQEVDRSGAAIVNETMARRYLPGQDPVGKQLHERHSHDGARRKRPHREGHQHAIRRSTADPTPYAPLSEHPGRAITSWFEQTDGCVVPALWQILLEMIGIRRSSACNRWTDLMAVGWLLKRIAAWVATIMESGRRPSGFVGDLWRRSFSWPAAHARSACEPHWEARVSQILRN